MAPTLTLSLSMRVQTSAGRTQAKTFQGQLRKVLRKSRLPSKRVQAGYRKTAARDLYLRICLANLATRNQTWLRTLCIMKTLKYILIQGSAMLSPNSTVSTINMAELKMRSSREQLLLESKTCSRTVIDKIALSQLFKTDSPINSPTLQHQGTSRQQVMIN